MKAMELRHKTPDELSGMLADLKKEQFNLRFQQASGQLENTARVKTVRHDIARIRTILIEQKSGKPVAPKKEEKPAKKAAKPTAKKEAKKEAKKAAPKKEAKAVAKKATKTAKKPAKAAAKKAKK